MKYGKILTYKDIEEAKKLIGKKVICSDALSNIEKNPECIGTATLESIETDFTYLFVTSEGTYQFIREVIEEEKPQRMNNKQLAEWCARGFGQWRNHTSIARVERMVRRGEENFPLDTGVEIRPWGSDKWIEPTEDIYLRDCRSGS